VAFYVDQRVFHGGALVLFQRNLAVAVPGAKKHRPAKWYMRLKIAGHKGYITQSTKLTSYEDAYEFAKNELFRLQHAANMGHSLDEYTFEKHWDDWYQRQVANGAWEDSRKNWHRLYAERYFKSYFSNADGSSKLLNEITPQVAAAYWDWRIAYWSSGQGERLIAYNPKRRGAKTRTTSNAKKAPSDKTLQMEQSALNQIFGNAAERGRIQQFIKFRPPRRRSGKQDRRPDFEHGEDYDTLVRYLRSYRDCEGVFRNDRVNGWHLQQRQQMYYFVLFLANSGLRVGEARQMTWADVKFDVPLDGSDLEIAEVRVPKRDTKKGEVRYVQTQPNANDYLKKWKELTPFKDKNDPVWHGQQSVDGKPSKFKDLNKGFQAFLRRVPVDGRPDGLLFNRDGERRTLYSLRHTYATMRRRLGNVDTEDLAMNMGCQPIQITKHYSHVTTQHKRREITKMVPKPNKKRKEEVAMQTLQPPFQHPAQQAMQDDAFKLEVVRRFQCGELSGEAMQAVLNSMKPQNT
jgi:integrase